MFRLLRLAGSAIQIASVACKASDCSGAKAAGVSYASAELLSTLLSYEKHLDKSAGGKTGANDSRSQTQKFPAFLTEFHSLWRTIEERDLARAELEEREEQISQLLSGEACPGRLLGGRETDTDQASLAIENSTSGVEQALTNAGVAVCCKVLEAQESRLFSAVEELRKELKNSELSINGSQCQNQPQNQAPEFDPTSNKEGRTGSCTGGSGTTNQSGSSGDFGKLLEYSKKLEADLRHTEKRFVQHLKSCCSTADGADESRGGLGNGSDETWEEIYQPGVDDVSISALELKCVHNSGDSATSILHQLNSDKLRLRNQLDARLIELSGLQSQVRHCSHTLHTHLIAQLSQVKSELQEASKKLAAAHTSGEICREEAAALQKRCDLFEEEFRNLEDRRISDESQIRDLTLSLEQASDTIKHLSKTVRPHIHHTPPSLHVRGQECTASKIKPALWASAV